MVFGFLPEATWSALRRFQPCGTVLIPKCIREDWQGRGIGHVSVRYIQGSVIITPANETSPFLDALLAMPTARALTPYEAFDQRVAMLRHKQDQDASAGTVGSGPEGIVKARRLLPPDMKKGD